MSLYLVVDKLVERPQLWTTRLFKQQYLSRDLFYDFKTRSVKFTVQSTRRQDELEKELDECLDENVLPVAKLLVAVKRGLVRAYVAVEENQQAYPDARKATLHMARGILPYYRQIREHFEKNGDVEIHPALTVAKLDFFASPVAYTGSMSLKHPYYY